MSKNGGYRIIDLQNKQLTPKVGMVFPGIYSAIEGTRKRIVFSGLNIGGKEYPDMEVIPGVLLGTTFMFIVVSSPAVTIFVSDIDVLTVEVDDQ